jgi:hypothetical protein
MMMTTEERSGQKSLRGSQLAAIGAFDTDPAVSDAALIVKAELHHVTLQNNP